MRMNDVFLVNFATRQGLSRNFNDKKFSFLYNFLSFRQISHYETDGLRNGLQEYSLFGSRRGWIDSKCIRRKEIEYNTRTVKYVERLSKGTPKVCSNANPFDWTKLTEKLLSQNAQKWSDQKWWIVVLVQLFAVFLLPLQLVKSEFI